MLFYDNKFVMHLTSSPSHYDRLKHIDIDYHFIHELIQKNSWLLFMSELSIKLLIYSPSRIITHVRIEH